uniref:Uncharacterized protein n=1 Tax=Arundo donax TaxID=35708 RepID=A0A0A9EKC0_ARUDO
MATANALQPEVVILGGELREVDVLLVDDLDAAPRSRLLLLPRHRPQPHERQDPAVRRLGVGGHGLPDGLQLAADGASQRELPRRRRREHRERRHRLLDGT